MKRFLINEITVLELHESLVRLFGAENILDKVTSAMVAKAENHREIFNQLFDICNDFNTIPLGPLTNLILSESIRNSLLVHPLDASGASAETLNPIINLAERPANPFDSAEASRRLSVVMQSQSKIKEVLQNVTEAELLSDPFNKATENTAWFPIPAFPLGPAWGHSFHVIGDVAVCLGGGSVASPAKFDCVSVMDMRVLAHRFVPCVGDIPAPRDKFAVVMTRIRPKNKFCEGGLVCVLFGGHEALMDGPENHNSTDVLTISALNGKPSFDLESATNSAHISSASSQKHNNNQQQSQYLTRSSSACFVLDIVRGKWTRLISTGSVPCPRSGHSLIAVPHSAPEHSSSFATQQSFTKEFSSESAANDLTAPVRSRRLEGVSCSSEAYTRSLVLFGGHAEQIVIDKSTGKRNISRASLNDLWVLDVESGWQWFEVQTPIDRPIPCARECHSMNWVGELPNGAVGFCIFGGAAFGSCSGRDLLEHHGILPLKSKSDSEEARAKEEAAMIAEASLSLESAPALLADLWTCELQFARNGRITGAKWKEAIPRGVIPAPRASHSATIVTMAAGDAANDPQNASLHPILVVIGGQVCEDAVSLLSNSNHGASAAAANSLQLANSCQPLLKPLIPHLRPELAARGTSLISSSSVAAFSFKTGLWHKLNPGAGIPHPPQLFSTSNGQQQGVSANVGANAPGGTANSVVAFEPRASSACMLMHISHNGSDNQLPLYHSSNPSAIATWPLGAPAILVHGGFSATGVLGDACVLSLSGLFVSGSLHGVVAHGLKDGIVHDAPLVSFTRLSEKKGSLAALLTPPLTAPSVDISDLQQEKKINEIKVQINGETEDIEMNNTSDSKLTTTTNNNTHRKEAITSILRNKTSLFPQPPPGIDGVPISQLLLLNMRSSSSSSIPPLLPFEAPPHRIWSSRRVASRATRPTYHFGLSWQLAVSIPSPLQAIGLLVDNARESKGACASKIGIRGIVTGRRFRCLVIEDDGAGLSPPKLCRLLNSYGRGEEAETQAAVASADAISHALGFKMAVARLGIGAMVFTKTSNSLCIGLLSAELNTSSQSLELVTPIAEFPLTSGKPRMRRACIERLLAHHGPFTPAELSMETQRVLDLTPASCTRVVVFGLRNDVDQLAFLSNGDITIAPPHSLQPKTLLPPAALLSAYHAQQANAQQSLPARYSRYFNTSACTELLRYQEQQKIAQQLQAKKLNVNGDIKMENEDDNSNINNDNNNNNINSNNNTISTAEQAGNASDDAQSTVSQTTSAATDSNNGISTANGISNTARLIQTPSSHQVPLSCGLPSCQSGARCSHGRGILDPPADVPSMYWTPMDILSEYRVSAPVIHPDEDPFNFNFNSLKKDKIRGEGIEKDHQNEMDVEDSNGNQSSSANHPLLKNDGSIEILHVDQLRQLIDEKDSSDLISSNSKGSHSTSGDASNNSSAPVTPGPKLEQQHTLVNEGPLEAALKVRNRNLGYHAVDYASTTNSDADVFPFWRCWENSIDASLRTALYWRHLFVSPSSCDILIGGNFSTSNSLLARGYNANDTPFNLLKNNLHAACYLPYLFSPSDSDNDGFILLGFLNDPFEKSTEKTNKNNRLAELGVLLYSSGRLINRQSSPIPQLRSYTENVAISDVVSDLEYVKKSAMENGGIPDIDALSFPVTVIVGMPRFWYPAPSSSSFAQQNSIEWNKVNTYVHDLVRTYLTAVATKGMDGAAEFTTSRREKFKNNLIAQQSAMNTNQESTNADNAKRRKMN